MQFSRLSFSPKKSTPPARPLAIYETSTIRYSADTYTSSRPSFASSFTMRSEEDLSAREYKLYYSRSTLYESPQPIDNEDRQPGHKLEMFLIPLDMAANVAVIKYRMEGFEMEEHRKHIRQIAKERD